MMVIPPQGFHFCYDVLEDVIRMSCHYYIRFFSLKSELFVGLCLKPSQCSQNVTWVMTTSGRW